jgi:hypothetical protein
VLQITIMKTPKGRYQVAWATRNGYGTIAADYRTVLGALLKGYRNYILAKPSKRCHSDTAKLTG